MERTGRRKSDVFQSDASKEAICIIKWVCSPKYHMWPNVSAKYLFYRAPSAEHQASVIDASNLGD